MPATAACPIATNQKAGLSPEQLLERCKRQRGVSRKTSPGARLSLRCQGWLSSCHTAEPSVLQADGHHCHNGCRRTRSPPSKSLDCKQRKSGATGDSLALSFHWGRGAALLIRLTWPHFLFPSPNLASDLDIPWQWDKWFSKLIWQKTYLLGKRGTKAPISSSPYSMA